jgi:peptidyl-prolyl cis-trans isomerase D
MIKLLRESARKYPWILKSIMGVLAIAFIITMGWWGFSEQEPDHVATVGDLSVSRDEYRRAYESTLRYYRENIKGEFKEETIKDFVIEGLIESKLWTIAAEDLGLSISPEELRDDLTRREEFQRNGKFDQDMYRRFVQLNRMTLAHFEAMHSMELLRNKARLIILDSVALTPAEVAEAEALVAHQPKDEKAEGAAARDRILQDLLFQKQQRALLAFREAMRAKTPIKIRKELL